ncbi:MAG TPA: orotidine-5'-phosphate decarboxylase, partial [Acidobacteria bacterium]|nr:orotidine-5'-phosphate decarboxylase [Acidobacteriota bacterium]
LCVALDGSDRSWIEEMAATLAPHAGWLKIGLEAFTAHGPELVAAINRAGGHVFLDLKLHDIPNTVHRAAANCAAMGVQMFNVHASGGSAMLQAAAEGAAEGARGQRPKVLAVTVLTSLDGDTLAELAIDVPPAELVIHWARLAQDCGLDGVVASAREAAAIRKVCGPDFLIVTPGIRPAWAATDDQRRIVTPARAMAGGSDILVIGRPITRATDPVEAARKVLEEIIEGSQGAV